MHGQLCAHGRGDIHHFSRVRIPEPHIQPLCIPPAEPIIIRLGIPKSRLAPPGVFVKSKGKLAVGHILKNCTCLAFQQHHFPLALVQRIHHLHKSAVLAVVGHHAGHAHGV